MWRHTIQPREGFEKIVEEQGLVFYDTPQPDGTNSKYWPEDAFYEFTEDEVLHLEGVTARLYDMCKEAARHMASGEMGNLGLHPAALELMRQSIEVDPVSIYSRFDLRFGGDGPAKMFEINGDTPTGLVESAVVQWYWLQDKMPALDQWNSLHERLVTAWTNAGPRLNAKMVHFAHLEAETSGEEWMTVAYMRDVATQAGLTTQGVKIEDIGWDHEANRFVDHLNVPMDACFKLYPWENMLRDRLDQSLGDYAEFGEFGTYIATDPEGTRWIEPIWKSLLSNKALLAALWQIYPGHENLLPAFIGTEPDPSLIEWIGKPLFGREGDGMKWSTIRDGDGQSPTHVWGDEGYVFQEWKELPSFDGYMPVMGCWVVEGKPAGLGIRESKSAVTDNFARFIPHIMSAPAPTQEEVTAMATRDEETFRKTEASVSF